jgi:hypothetical protein
MRRKIGKENMVKVYIHNSKAGINLKRLWMALNLLFSEKDVLEYFKNAKNSEVPSHTALGNGVLAKNP